MFYYNRWQKEQPTSRTEQQAATQDSNVQYKKDGYRQLNVRQFLKSA